MKIDDIEIPDFLIDDINNYNDDIELDDNEIPENEFDETKISGKIRKDKHHIHHIVKILEKIDKIDKLTYTTSSIKFYLDEFSEKFILHFNTKYYFLEIEYPEFYYTVKSENIDRIIKFINDYNEQILQKLQEKYTISEKEIEIKVLEPHITKKYIAENRKKLKYISIVGNKIEYYRISINSLNYSKSFRKDDYKLEEIINIRDEVLNQCRKN